MNMQIDSMIDSGHFRILTQVSEHRIPIPYQYVTSSPKYLLKHKNVPMF